MDSSAKDLACPGPGGGAQQMLDDENTGAKLSFLPLGSAFFLPFQAVLNLLDTNVQSNQCHWPGWGWCWMVPVPILATRPVKELRMEGKAF